MKIFCLVLAVVLFLTVSLSSNAQSKSVVTYNSFGGVKIGMTVPKASKAFGVRLVREPTYDGNACYYVKPKQGFKNVSFMVTNGSIARIDIYGKGYATDKGAKIGDTEARIKSLYKGMVKASRHPYDEKGHYLEVKFASGNYSIIFETDGKRVTSFRAGRSEEVGYIEGCS
jgi:hypothetical protein